MKKIKKIVTGLFILALFGAWMSFVTTDFKVQPESSSMVIKGTSTIHDWEMMLDNMNVNVSVTNEKSLLVIEKANFTAQVKNLTSESSLMDKKAHEALKSDKFPQVKFELSSLPKVEVSNGVFKGTATGNLSIAGVTKTISFPFSGNINGNNEIRISGSEKLDMTQFGIDPPTAMLGSLKTDKNITVTFSLDLKQQ